MQVSFHGNRSREFESEENPHSVKQSKGLSSVELVAGMAEILIEASTKLSKKTPFISRHVPPSFKVKLYCFGQKIPFTFKISAKGELTLIKEPKFLNSPFFELNESCQHAVLGALSEVAKSFSLKKQSVTSVVDELTETIDRKVSAILEIDRLLDIFENTENNDEDGKRKLDNLNDQRSALMQISRPANLPGPEPKSRLPYTVGECVLVRKWGSYYPDRFLKYAKNGDLDFSFNRFTPKNVFSSIAFRSRNDIGRSLPNSKDRLYKSQFDSKKLNNENLLKRLEWFQKNFQVEEQESLDRIFALASEITTAELGTVVAHEKVEGLPNFLTTPFALNERVIVKRTDGTLSVGEVLAIFNEKIEILVGNGTKKVSENNVSRLIVFKANPQIPFSRLEDSQIE